MRQRAASAVICLPLLIAICATGCGDDTPLPCQSVTPCPSSTPVTLTTPVASGTPQSIAVTGSLAFSGPGETSQLSVFVTFGDGSTRDVTALASCRRVPYSYSIAPSSVVNVTPTGCLVSAANYGKEEVEICYPAPGWWPAPPGTLVAHAVARVVPPGGYVLYGRLTESGYPLKDARVEATTAAGRVSSAVDANGNYMLAPVAGDIELNAAAGGYVGLSRRIKVTGDQQLDLELQRSEAPKTVAGVYQLTITAGPSCSLPADARQRTYPAKLVEGRAIPSVYDLVVTLAGAEFVVWGNDAGFTGTRNGSQATFPIGTNWDGDYGLVELIDLSKELYYNGTAVATIGDRAITGSFVGSITVKDRFSQAVLGSCQASDHKFEMVR
jgi:hypothetical protein